MKRKDALYELLIQHAGTYCSGEVLAQELGISRAAVWKAIQTLRTESNVPIQSHPKKGYCIPADADPQSRRRNGERGAICAEDHLSGL